MNADRTNAGPLASGRPGLAATGRGHVTGAPNHAGTSPEAESAASGDDARLEPIVFKAREVALLLQIPIDQVRLATVNGHLPHRQLGTSSRGIRYTREDIDAYVARQARVGAGNRSAPDEATRVLPAPRRRGSPAA